MALLTSYGDFNRVVDSESEVWYSTEMLQGEWTWAAGPYIDHYYQAYLYKRHKTKSYRYVGMTYATARNCLTDKIALLTREIYLSIWGAANSAEFYDVRQGVTLLARINLVHDGGAAYSVRIDIDESDEKMRRIPVGDPASLFTRENSRDYDEGA